MTYYVGIDLGGTNIKAGIVDENGVLLNKDSIKTMAERPMRDLLPIRLIPSVSAHREHLITKQVSSYIPITFLSTWLR